MTERSRSRPLRHSATAGAAPALPCLCASLRRAARAVTQLYEVDLRKVGMRATQFTLLQALEAREGITQKVLGRLLSVDSTTLSRTLAVLERRGWIGARPGTDRRERRLALTPAGRRQLERTRPLWRRAQGRLRKRLGPEAWEQALAALEELTRRAQCAGSRPGASPGATTPGASSSGRPRPRRSCGKSDTGGAA